jgi:hypothetical protein
MRGMPDPKKASTFGSYLPKKARKCEHFGSRGAPRLSPPPPNVTLSGYLYTIFEIAMVSEVTSLSGGNRLDVYHNLNKMVNR